MLVGRRGIFGDVDQKECFHHDCCPKIAIRCTATEVAECKDMLLHELVKFLPMEERSISC